MISTQLYNHLPVYARMLDERGLLEHVCRAIQPQFNELLRQLDQLEYLFDPRSAPDSMLSWLEQVFGAGPVGDQWLGLGSNPDWPAADKRRLIEGLWRYWQLKGTQFGIREAVALWLRWPEAHDPKRLYIILPFGKSPTAHPPLWWSYATPFNAHLLQSFPELQRLGHGDYYDQSYRPNWFNLSHASGHWQYGAVWSDRTLVKAAAPEEVGRRSHMGPRSPWRHFFLKNESEWERIFPDIFELEPEMSSSRSRPTDIGWMLLEGVPAVRLMKDRSDPSRNIVQRIEVDGFKYYDIFPSVVTEPREVSRTVRREVAFGNYPGFQYGDQFGGVGDALYPAEQWYSSYQTRTVEETITEIEPGNSCRPGAVLDVVTGYEERIVGEIPPSPGNQAIQSVDREVEVQANLVFDEEIEGELAALSEIDLSGLAPIDLPDEPFEYDVTGKVVRAIEEFAFPIEIATYYTLLNPSYPWYFSGSDGQEGTLQQVPIVRQLPVCNTVDNWTTFTITSWKEEEEDLPEVERSLTDVYPLLSSFSNANSWQLLIETPASTIVLQPTTIFWSRDREVEGAHLQRSLQFSLEQKHTNLYLEFVFQPTQSTFFRSLSLIFDKDEVVDHRHFTKDLSLDRRGVFGFRYLIPMEAETAVR